MKLLNKNLILSSSLLAFIVLSLLAGTALLFRSYAAESMPSIVEDAWGDIGENQKVIEIERPHKERFDAAKTDNAVQVGRMLSACYDYDWNLQKPVKLSDCRPL